LNPSGITRQTILTTVGIFCFTAEHEFIHATAVKQKILAAKLRIVCLVGSSTSGSSWRSRDNPFKVYMILRLKPTATERRSCGFSALLDPQPADHPGEAGIIPLKYT